MFQTILEGRKLARRVSLFALAVFVFLFNSAGASADNTCFQVEGHYEEHLVSGPECTSPAGLCIAGEYRGDVKGSFFGKATSLVPTADTPTTSVVLFTSDSVIHAQVHGQQGDLMIKNAGAFQSAGAGNIVDLQIITGGTGGLSGASGAIRASGLFNPTTGTGTSAYEGTVCLP